MLYVPSFFSGKTKLTVTMSSLQPFTGYARTPPFPPGAGELRPKRERNSFLLNMSLRRELVWCLFVGVVVPLTSTFFFCRGFSF